MLQSPRAQIRLAPTAATLPNSTAGTFASIMAATPGSPSRQDPQRNIDLIGPRGWTPADGARNGNSPASGQPATPGAGKASISTDYARYLGHSAGSGQCVALVQATSASIGPTRKWTCGASVRGNTDLRPGTAIATFDGSAHYANAMDGSSHAAIYLGQNEHGVQVMDQWSGSAAAVRTIPWTNPGGKAANTGSAFHVVHSA